MHHDLRKSAQAISKYLTQRVKDYPKHSNEGAGKNDESISLVPAGCQFDQLAGHLSRHAPRRLSGWNCRQPKPIVLLLDDAYRTARRSFSA